MVHIRTQFVAAALAVLMSGGAFGQPAVPPPVAAPTAPTLWSFLGVPQGFKKVKGALTNRNGNRPQAEPKDALKALNDPANLESPDAAIKRAAEIKKAEDLKPQKIKAIKYLTSIGCGCYDKDGSVTDALVAASEDCTEDVRLATMQEIHAAAKGKCCSNCGQVCCCNDKMMKKLAQVAYERDEFGCYGEPSKRVRDAAAAALAACCPGSVPLEILLDKPAPAPLPEPVPEREKTQDILPERERSIDGERVKAVESDGVTAIQRDQRAPVHFRLSSTASDERFAEQPRMPKVHMPMHTTSEAARGEAAQLPAGIVKMRSMLAASSPHMSSSPNPQGGVVLAYESSTRTAYVHFEQANKTVPVGTPLHLRPDPRVSNGFNGMWQVVESSTGCAVLQPMGSEGVDRIRVGDHANFGMPPVLVAPISYIR